MLSTKELYNEIFQDKALINSSLYLEKSKKVIRFADHLANPSNFEKFNADAESLFLVYVGSELTEEQIQNNVSEIEGHIDLAVEYVHYSDESDLEYIKAYTLRFFENEN